MLFIAFIVVFCDVPLEGLRRAQCLGTGWTVPVDFVIPLVEDKDKKIHFILDRFIHRKH